MKKSLVTITVLSLVAAIVMPFSVANAQSSATTVQSQNLIHRRKHFGPVILANAIITMINGTSMTVTDNGATYTVLTDTNTVFVRRFFGRSNIGQFSVGDHIYVRGMWSDSAKTIADADYIRDISIQERHDTFSGTVTSLSSNGFDMQSRERGSIPVSVSSNSKLLDKNGNTISLSQISVNDSVTVDGMWDRILNTATATWIKDYSLPRS